MTETDLNLLVALDALLAEGSVAGAARRLGLSESAMSRTLARLRAATGDGLLVRAGRNLVATPHAEALRARVRDLAQEARAVLRPPPESLDIATVERTLTLRANDGFNEAFAPRILAAVAARAPGLRLHFAPKPDKDVAPLRDGRIDLEIGVLGASGPEVRVQALFRDRFVGVARAGHPLLTGPMTAERFAAFGHVATWRRGHRDGVVDEALARLGLRRRVACVVPSFSSAVAIALATDLVALMPRSYLRGGAFRPESLSVFEPPVELAGFTVSQMWHPRLDGDGAHRWLRELIRELCGERPGGEAVGGAG
jgi:DNA-binding transcriptional LysR family regulator